MNMQKKDPVLLDGCGSTGIVALMRLHTARNIAQKKIAFCVNYSDPIKPELRVLAGKQEEPQEKR